MNLTRIPTLLAALLPVGLSGCAAGPDFERPATPGSGRYAAGELVLTSGALPDGSQHLVPGQEADTEWWKLFGSPALDEIVQRAMSGNRSLAAAEASLEEANELVRARTGSLLPQVSATGGTGRQKYGAQFLGSLAKPPPFTYFALGARVSYAVDYTGGALRGVEQQRALAEYQRYQMEAARLAVGGSAILLALQEAMLREQVAAVEELLGRDRENLTLVEESRAAGAAADLDVLTARSQLASDATLLPPLRQQMDATRHALAVLTGSTPADAALPVPTMAEIRLPAELPLSIPSELAHRRPDILAAEAQLHAATAAVGVATANLYPHITLSASIGQESVRAGRIFDGGSSVWSLAAGVLAPIFDGGTLRAQKRATVAAMRANAASYEQVVLEAFGQVADALQALSHGVELLQAESTAESAARQTADLTRRAWQEGEASLLEVLDAERRYQQARLAYVRARGQRYLDSAQLLLAIGPGAAR